MNGILVYNKPTGAQSQSAITLARKLFGIKKVGHCGTLDPLASGVLPLMIGSATKACNLLMDHEKTYVTCVKLGITTDTEDVTGNILTEYNGSLPSFEAFKEAAESFKGEITQIPPMYSALKKDGKKLVDLARKGIEIERQPRNVIIHEINAYEKDGNYMLSVRCSRGTYIRTLCADIGKKLGCGACMETLCRTSVGAFTIEKSYTPDQLKALSKAELEQTLIPLNDVFADLPVYGFRSDSDWKRYVNGERVPDGLSPAGRYRVLCPGEPNKLHSLAEIRAVEGGNKLCSFIRFE
ncbi:MAG: tRNA pseudouridine(55) synthase TruB [Clostridia bacterium]|nr:tRNA pseudouridine(55) synthase TruB [Clostridia bacterium]